MDIPGFYYDPQKKKYFRITAGSSRHVILNEQEAKVRKQQDVTRQHLSDSHVNTPSFVNSYFQMQQGQITPSNLTEQLMKIRINDAFRNRKETYVQADLQLDMRDNSPKCVMAKYNSEKQVIHGIWSDFSGSIISRVDVNLESANESQKVIVTGGLNLPPCCSVLDIDYFHGDCDVLFCLNHFRDRSSCLLIESTLADPDDPLVTRMNFEFEYSYKSCAAGDGKFALGGDKQIKVLYFNANFPLDNCNIYTLQWAVTAMKFLNSGMSPELLAGTANGFIRLYDIRSKEDDSSQRMRVGYYTINSLAQVDSNKWLVAGHSNNLCLIDRRNLKGPVLQFAEHVNSCHKLEPSVDSVTRVVCSPGEDCVTRFWSLDSGNLMTQLPLMDGLKVKATHLLHSWLGGSLPAKSVLSIYGNKINRCTF